MVGEKWREIADTVLSVPGKILGLEAGLFLFPVACAILTREPGTFYMGFYIIWFFVAATVNILFIVMLLIRRPYNYWLRALGFFIVPPALGVLGVFIAMLCSGVTC